ncbi:hypothetical protein N0V88_000103 [Collariella sp. IMI 366227]|nr:hypothetical protein N0V88_000103 [Collariella sp. IMI 366227]
MFALSTNVRFKGVVGGESHPGPRFVRPMPAIQKDARASGKNSGIAVWSCKYRGCRTIVEGDFPYCAIHIKCQVNTCGEARHLVPKTDEYLAFCTTHATCAGRRCDAMKGLANTAKTCQEYVGRLALYCSSHGCSKHKCHHESIAEMLCIDPLGLPLLSDTDTDSNHAIPNRPRQNQVVPINKTTNNHHPSSSSNNDEDHNSENDSQPSRGRRRRLPPTQPNPVVRKKDFWRTAGGQEQKREA